jgi:Cu+-exporting ATPase
MSDKCFHCGDQIIGKPIRSDEHEFCCQGCSSVYMLLKNSDLGNFYQYEQNAGVRPSNANKDKFNFLDVDSIRQSIIQFEDEHSARTTLYLPSIHCSSCIYLLENSPKLLKGIISCEVNFAKREAVIVYEKEVLKLSELAYFLDSIGYTPNFGNRKENQKAIDKQFMYKLGIAGFTFGSIMLWTFPEYLGIEKDNPEFRNFTSLLSLAVSIPVLLYSAMDYLRSAYTAIKHKTLNLDVPITIGIIALYIKSASSILQGEGPGYMDSFAGFIFFLLIGKWFQNKTYQMLSFERDYSSYFPMAVTKITDNIEEIVEIEKITPGDIFMIRNEEVIPCDSIMISDEATIDYSFVTGESEPIHRKKGDFIYAGGKLLQGQARFKAEKETSRSHLTSLWNEVKSEKSGHTGFLYQNKLSVYFLAGLLMVAAGASVLWAFIEPSRITDIVVSILIVACPCALALSAPFTFGNIMRSLGRKGLYLKNTAVIERINQTTDIVFDKTGTLTVAEAHQIDYYGDELTDHEKLILLEITRTSTHPLSRAISLNLIQYKDPDNELSLKPEEIQSKGLRCEYNDQVILLGSAAFVNAENKPNETTVFLRFGNKKGMFVFSSELRRGLNELIPQLNKYKLHVVSGDQNKDEEMLKAIFPSETIFLFNQTPANKHDYVKELQNNGKKVLMIGDGLNDSGALGIANVGIAVSEDIFRFTPSSDAILEGKKFHELSRLLNISEFSGTVLMICLAFSLSYNVVGLSFAISGNLSPLIAAILMPISSITVVLISTLLAQLKK